MSRRKLTTFALVLLAVSLAGAAFCYRAHTTSASYLLRQGRLALEGDRWDEGERQAADLESRGHPAHAHLLRGDVWVRKGRLLLASPAPGGALDREAAARRPQALAALRRA